MRGEGDAVGVGAHGDALAFHDLADRLRDILVLARDQPRLPLDHRHLRTEAAEHLRELQPDIAAADHRQMPRQGVQLQDRGVGQVVDRVDAGQVRHRGATADVEEDARRA